MSERRLSKRTSAIKKREALAVKLEKRKVAVSRKLGRQKPVQSQGSTPVVDDPGIDADTNSVASLEWDHNESPPSFLTAENSSESFRSDIDQVLDEIHRLGVVPFALSTITLAFFSSVKVSKSCILGKIILDLSGSFLPDFSFFYSFLFIYFSFLFF